MDGFREQVREFIAELVPPGWIGIGALEDEEHAAFRAGTRAALAHRGRVAPAWPEDYGGAGLGPTELVVLVEELTGAGIPFGSDNDAFGISMLGNTVLRLASPELCTRFLPRIVSAHQQADP